MPPSWAWSDRPFSWGVFGVPEADLHALGDVAGLDVIELGCGTAYFAAWLARQGARPVGVDVTPAQLDTARRMQEETGLTFPLIEANAEDVPLPGCIASTSPSPSTERASGAIRTSGFPEAHRLLRPGGRLVFLTNSPLNILCAVEEPDSTSETLQRPQRGLHRLDWSHGGVEFHLGHGDCSGFSETAASTSRRLVELYAPDDAADHPYYDAQ